MSPLSSPTWAPILSVSAYVLVAGEVLLIKDSGVSRWHPLGTPQFLDQQNHIQRRGQKVGHMEFPFRQDKASQPE